MADSVTVADLPDGFDVYGAYDDGSYANLNAAKARFPDKTVLAFTVFAIDHFGDCLDVENGDATPAQAPGWVQARRAAGHGGPLVYCSEALWPTVKACFDNAKVAQPGYIIAGYPGSVGANLYPGSVGHQWIDRGPYDESVVADYLPGIDPAPSPPPEPPTPKENDTMTTWSDLKSDGTEALRHVTAVVNGKAYHWWQPPGGNATGPKWSVEELPTP